MIIPFDIAHELLVPEPKRSEFPDKGTATLTFMRQRRRFNVGQSVGLIDNVRQVDAHALGLLDFARLLYGVFAPEYGWIDTAVERCPSAKSVSGTNLDYIFWANFFGPKRAASMGDPFLFGAPGHVKEQLADGGFLYVTTKSYWSWMQTEQKRVLKYFQSLAPNVELFTAKIPVESDE